MSTEVKIWFSAAEIAALGTALIGGLPTSERGSSRRAKQNQWEYRIVHGKGGKGGLKTEYKLPPEVMKIVRMFLSENPVFFEKDKNEIASSKHYPVSKAAKPFMTGSGGQSNGLTAQQGHSITDMRVNDFLPMPKYSLQTMPDQAIHSDQVVDYLAFNRDWLQYSMDIHDQALALIKMKGDSMSPTLKNNDLMLTDLTQLRLEDDSIYVLNIRNELVVKRVQRKLNGSFVISTDNGQNKNNHEEVDAEAAMDLPIIGKVIWYGRVI